MAKIEFSYSLDGWMFTTVEGETLEECRDRLMSMSFEELLENGLMKSFDIKNVDEKILEKNVKVKVTSVEYDITDADLEFTVGKTDEEIEDEIRAISSKLPQTFEFTLKTDNKESFLEYDICDLISDETGWSVQSCTYDVLEEF